MKRMSVLFAVVMLFGFCVGCETDLKVRVSNELAADSVATTADSLGTPSRVGERIVPFPLEKVLTVSAVDYCKVKDHLIHRYDLVGVHAESLEEFLLKIPSNAVVVVGFRLDSGTNPGGPRFIHCSGTALVPRK